MKADHNSIKRRLNIAKGQIDGIINMIDQDRYCVDISTQIMATQSLLKNANREILKSHIRNCVKNGIENNDNSKLEEALELLEKFLT